MLRDRIVPLIIAVALFMENMDSTVIATSLPAIAADIGTNPLALKLAVTSYLLSLAIFIPASGWTADRFGARTVFRAAIAVFVLGSIGCALSSSLTDFVIARIVQGMGGAMMTPVGRMVVVRTISKRELIGAMAWVTTPALIGPVLGPPVGGFITTYATWHWIFIINVPIGLLGIVLATRYIPDVRAEEHERFDVVGMMLAGLGIGGMAFGLSVLGLNFLPWFVVVALVFGGACFVAAYLAHARHTENPALDLTLFRLPTFFASVVGGFIFRLGLGALPFLLPLMLQIGFGMTPFQSGMITFATALGAMGMKWAVAFILRRFGFRNILVDQFGDQLCLPRHLRRFHRDDTDCADGGLAFRRRVFPFVAIHQHQHHRLCRCGSPAHRPSDGARQRRAATVRFIRCRPWGHGGGTDRLRQGRRSIAGCGLPAGISGGRGDIRAFGADLCAAGAGRRRRDGRQAADPGGAFRSTRRLSGRGCPAKSCCQQIQFGRIRSARRRLDVLDAFIVSLEGGKQRRLSAALQHFCEERAAWRKHFAREFGGRFHQRHDLEMVGARMSGCIGRHVGEHDIGGASHHFLEFVRRGSIEEIEFDEVHSRHRVHR